MTEPVKRLYNEAKVNVDFHEALKKVREDYYKPGLFWSEEEKILYASVYMGWLMGKDQYDRKNYEY